MKKFIEKLAENIRDTGYQEYRRNVATIVSETLFQTDKTWTKKKEKNFFKKCDIVV